MNTQSLATFQYGDTARFFMVNATEYDSPIHGKFWRVRVVEHEKHVLHCPRTREEAKHLANGAIAGFVSRLNDLYNHTITT